jgi:PKD repeat protein
MNILLRINVCFKNLISGIILFLILLFIPFSLSAQTVTPQSCGKSQSWIARWTYSVTGGFVPYKMTDGDTNTSCEDVLNGQKTWTYDFNFGIVRSLTRVKLYQRDGLYSLHFFKIYVSTDNITFSLVKSVTLSYTAGAIDNIIDFGGYVDAKYLRIEVQDAWQNPTTFNHDHLRIWEANFFQCGVDPMIAKTISPGAAIAPSLSCADAISTSIQGIVNTYFPGLSDASKGSAVLSVDMNHIKGTAHTLVAGDRVLIIQMQNTLIDETNSNAYGDGIDNDVIASGWKDVKNTGEYEFGIVSSVSGNTIQLTQPLQKSYSADGVFQVVYSPVYDNVTLTGTITAADWDGYCGGIVTFDAKTLNLNNQSIDVSGQGFRKGKKNSNSNVLLMYWGVYCTDNDLYFGEKGEGIAGSPRGSYLLNSKRLYSPQNATTKSGGSFGRGAPANAGAGGSDVNSGGGGGANTGSGGQGGASFGVDTGDMTVYWSTTTPDGGPSGGTGFFPNGGMGGTGTGTPDPFRIWMGGAGGGGHQNNNAASGGSNGGGIVLVTSRVVKGSGNLSANGLNAENTIITGGLLGNDGAGGGGAGGTIVFGFDDQSAATLTYSAKGGNGGSINGYYIHGPGGGGGGGSIIASASSASMNVSGGSNGIHIASGSQWGANKGQDGKTLLANSLSLLYTYSCDHGDAPISFGDAAHQLKPDSLALGTPPDAEAMALNQPPHDKDAKGDDLTGKNDEDGVEQPFDSKLSPTQTSYRVKIFVHNPLNETVYECGWIDFNKNGLFDDNEKTSVSGILNGPNYLTWTSFPTNLTSGDTYARFRISTGIEALQPTGIAPDGEVEDFLIHFNLSPTANPDDTIIFQGKPVNIFVVKNDDIQGDKTGYIAILTQPANGVAVTNDNNTPNDKTDDFITYTPNPGFIGIDSLIYELWNSAGIKSNAKVTIDVKASFTVDFKATSDEDCTPLTVKFTNLSSDPTAKFEWDFGDNSPLDKNFETVHTFNSVSSTTIFNVKLKMITLFGSKDTVLNVTVHSIPHAVLIEKSNDDMPEIVVFTDISNNIATRSWTIDGIVMGNAQVITAKFDTLGPHTISLRVFNAFGCSDDTVIVHNTTSKGLFVPNAFIPDSPDQLVNTFKPIGWGVKEYTLMIFDLWGNLIWKDSQLNKNGQPLIGWDGKDMHGKPLPTDAYIWRISAVLEGGKPWKGMKMPGGAYRTEGTVTIIR